MFDPSLDDARATLPAIREAAFGVLLGAVAAAQHAGELRDGDISETTGRREWADTVTRLGLTGLSRR